MLHGTLTNLPHSLMCASCTYKNHIVTGEVSSSAHLIWSTICFKCLSIFHYVYISYQHVDKEKGHYDQKDDPQEVCDDGE